MKHATSKFLFGYWNEIRDGRLAPKRFELEPGRMGGILPDTFILEHTETGGFTFRLAGTRLNEYFEDELRHVEFFEIWSADDKKIVRDILEEITARGGVGRIECDVQDDDGNNATVEYVIFPLIHSRNTIDRLVGAMSVLSNSSWLGKTPITSQKILAHEIIWPDGRPHSCAQKMTQEPALAPHMRTARIVRIDRRQFRVYEGGLSTDTGRNDRR